MLPKNVAIIGISRPFISFRASAILPVNHNIGPGSSEIAQSISTIIVIVFADCAEHIQTISFIVGSAKHSIGRRTNGASFMNRAFSTALP